ncbi:MAG TPA: LytTR family DNA-binding domain-containing protein [Thermoanaerobaculia bacterium]|nr:LytTR family DNA-binding domain-containing protein [Thermoanaerobaculia bacterium]
MIRALVVDDERPARAKLRSLLAAAGDVAVVGEAADGEAAVSAIRELGPDVVFLDVQMPRGDGFAVVEAVGVSAMPLVVFVTAFDEHALRAFEVHAVDYLLKPFASKRLAGVLARVRERLASRSAAALAEGLAALLGERGGVGPRYVERILARRDEEREVLVAVETIDLLRAEGNYVRLFTRQGELTRRATLGALAAQLDPARFLRINRSEVVRLDAVAELRPWFHGDYRILLKDGTRLTWSRRYRKEGATAGTLL